MLSSYFKLNKKCNKNLEALTFMGTFDNVPTGRILYHEGQDVCYDVLKLIIFISDRTDDVNYIFPVRSIQIDFDFMKQIANKVFEYNINLANYYLRYEDEKYLAEKGLIYFDYDDDNKSNLELLIGTPIELNTMTELMLLDIWQPDVPPTTLIKLILNHEWSSTKESRDFLFYLKRFYKRIAIYKPRKFTNVENEIISNAQILSKNQRHIKKKILDNPRDETHSPNIADYFNCYIDKFSEIDILIAMDVDMYFRRLIPQNLVDTSKYTSFYDILQGVQKLRRKYKRFLVAKTYSENEVRKLKAQRGSEILGHLDILNHVSMQDFLVYLDKSLNALTILENLGSQYKSMKYAANYYERNKETLKATPVVKFVLKDILINSKNSIIKDIWKRSNDSKTFENRLKTYLFETGFVYVYRTIWSNNKYLGSWFQLNLKYNSKKEVIKSNYKPQIGIFYNQIRCGMLLYVIVTLCEKDKKLLPLFFNILKQYKKHNEKITMFKFKEILMIYYTKIKETGLQNDIKTIIQCIPDTFKFSSSEYYKKHIFKEEIGYVKRR